MIVIVSPFSLSFVNSILFFAVCLQLDLPFTTADQAGKIQVSDGTDCSGYHQGPSLMAVESPYHQGAPAIMYCLLNECSLYKPNPFREYLI